MPNGWKKNTEGIARKSKCGGGPSHHGYSGGGVEAGARSDDFASRGGKNFGSRASTRHRKPRAKALKQIATCVDGGGVNCTPSTPKWVQARGGSCTRRGFITECGDDVRENTAVATQSDTIEDHNSCQICLSDTVPTVDLGGCGHFSCRGCLTQQYAVHAPTNSTNYLPTKRGAALVCFGVGCNRSISGQQLRLASILQTEDDWRHFYRMKTVAARRWRPENSGWSDADIIREMETWQSEHDELWKRCPRCRELINKNGGCSHMRCHCGHDFTWTDVPVIGKRDKRSLGRGMW